MLSMRVPYSIPRARRVRRVGVAWAKLAQRVITQEYNGGLVSIGQGSIGDVSVVNSNLTDVGTTAVRTLCEYPSTVLYIRQPLSTLMIVRA